VNLLVDRAGAGYSISSRLPQEGKLEIYIRKPKRLRVRIPENAIRESTRVTVNGKVSRPDWSGHYLCLGTLSQNVSVCIEFENRIWRRVERLNGRDYDACWLGDTVTGIEGGRVAFKRLY
jgi:hypothetical protein